ncbi:MULTISPECIES: DUF806 family protein [unclassified Mammaliicoccus]|uniref:DUF806 family protein n=1 Tax=unclassified Mammaliicoccus TaxID=2803851 RepID=UPI001EFB1B3C|nr:MULTISPECIES: DUF806 family protein [unclassified Mammaliicoccus]
MKNITDELYQLIVNNGEITVSDNIFKYVVPQNFHETTNKPIVRITPLPYTPENYADDQQLSREYDYQIDIWWSENEPFEQAEMLVFLLKKMNFQAYYREPLYEVETFTFREIIRAKATIITLKN